MTGDASLLLDLLIVLGWGVLATTVIVALRALLEVLPLGQDRREAALRAFPLLVLAAGFGFALLSIRQLFADYPGALPFALLAVLLAFFAISWNLLREVLAGIALRAETPFETGDYIRVAGVEGRVLALSPRAIMLETPEGDVIYVPYTEATEHPVVRSKGRSSETAHTFELRLGAERPLSDVLTVLERAALLNHWSSLARPPEFQQDSKGAIMVTVHSLAPERAMEIEADVRRAATRAFGSTSS